ncbi:DEBR0S4_10946g1_1 [Brettanomyces bruxellensis]|uniref:DEBR0S4_10946g1_1 n=1 Tax=Dekkera bruxellensis TaxID=5007 RepID=A0A7D9CYS1_DEKBR|nr:DEBR0S4_10946g1_1 [Brettanomyces bruxellensis]
MQYYALRILYIFFFCVTGLCSDDKDSNDITDEFMMKDLQSLDLFDVNGMMYDQRLSLLGQTSILQDWTPIRATIGLNDSLTYTFDVNYTSPGLAHSFEVMVFISAAICEMPDSLEFSSQKNGLSLYYTFESNVANLSAMNRISFVNGYAEGLASSDGAENHRVLYVTIKPDDCESCTLNDTWIYELGLSQSDLVFQYDNNPIISVADTDFDSAAFSAENLTFRNDSTYTVYLYNRSQYTSLSRLNQSWCAIANADEYVKQYPLESSAVVSEKKFFSVTDLQKSTNYTGVLLQTFNTVNYGGSVYKLFNFSTMGSNACKVIYGLDFCDEVAYATPASRNLTNGQQTVQELASIYDNYTKELYQQFDYALQQIPCDAHLDSRYSPIRTCENCRYSYKQWLCSVTIPRCSSEEQEGYKRYNSSDGRNSFIADTIDPPLSYYEILPCISMCNAIVRDCPSDFGFACPTRDDFLGVSYGVNSDDTSNLTCNYVGNNDMDSDNLEEQVSTGGAALISPSFSVRMMYIAAILFYLI